MSTGINVTKPIKILDEGVQLTADVSQIDFTGGVTATTVGNNVTVNVPAAGITVGTTPVTSGTDGRVFFQEGGVVQQSANLFWDNTNNALGLGASPLSTSRLDIRAKDGLSTSQSLRIGRSTDNATQFEVTGDGRVGIGGNASNLFILNVLGASRFTDNIELNKTNHRIIFSGSTAQGGVLCTSGVLRLSGGGSGSATNYTAVRLVMLGDISAGPITATSGTINIAQVAANGDGNQVAPTSGNLTYNALVVAPGFNTTGTYSGIGRGIYYNPTLTSTTGLTHRAIETTTGDVIFGSTSGNVAIGSTSPGARLDVRAQGALSTDIAFRVRNSADTNNIVNFNGNGQFTIGLGASINLTANAAPEDTVVIGRGANAGLNGVAVGASSQADWNSSVSIGRASRAGITSVAVGANATAYNGALYPTLAVGYNANASGIYSGIISVGDVTAGNPIGSSIAFTIQNSSNTQSFFFNRNTNVVLKSNSALTSGTDFEAAATNTITIHNGTAPTTNIATAGQLYAESGALRYRDSAGTITNVGGSVQAVVSAATVTPVYTNKFVKITAQAAALTLANPTGTWAEGQDLMIRIKDDGTARAITWDTNYRAIGVTLPTTTVINKTTYVGIIYNSTDGKWDAIGVTTEA